MSHKAYNLQLLIIYSQFSVLSGNVCRKDNFHHLPPSLSTGTPQKKKIIEPCIFQDHSRLKKLKNFAKPLSLSNIAPHLFSRIFKVDCCPISMPQIITSTLLQTPQKPTLFSCFVNSFAIDARCGKKRSINTSGIKINQSIKVIFLGWRQNRHPTLSLTGVHVCR